jgi:hypothetical protein
MQRRRLFQALQDERGNRFANSSRQSNDADRIHHNALTMLSDIFLASPSSIIVLSR